VISSPSGAMAKLVALQKKPDANHMVIFNITNQFDKLRESYQKDVFEKTRIDEPSIDAVFGVPDVESSKGSHPVVEMDLSTGEFLYWRSFYLQENGQLIAPLR